MKRKLQLKKSAGIALASGILVSAGLSLVSIDLNAFNAQPPNARTNSPGDGATCTGCHSGIAIPLTQGITTDIPAAGYVAGQTYNVTVGGADLEQTGVSKYGFQLSPQDASGNLLGTLAAGTGSTLSGGGKYVSHAGAQNSSTPSWTFQWTAPTSGIGEVTFYASVLAANGNGNTTGDQVLTTTHTVQEAVTSIAGVNAKEEMTASGGANGSLNLQVSTNTVGAYVLNVFDLNGSSVHSSNLNLQSGDNVTTVQLGSAVSKGTYVVTLSYDNKHFTSKVIF